MYLLCICGGWPVPDLFYFFRLAEIPPADSLWPKNKNTGVKKMTFLWLNLKLKFFMPIEHQLNVVKHYFNARGKNTDVIQVKQQGDKLLVP